MSIGRGGWIGTERLDLAGAFAVLLVIYCPAPVEGQVTFIKGVKYERIDDKWFT
jgi:hypothetical protein